MKLTATNVHEVMMKCLFDEGESQEGHIIADGVMMKVGFHPGRIKENEQNIISMLSYLPDQFKTHIGGGWSFMNACQDNEGNQWADLHQTIDELVCLGLAIGKVKYQMPREMWSALPGGMPYFSVNEILVEHV